MTRPSVIALALLLASCRASAPRPAGASAPETWTAAPGVRRPWPNRPGERGPLAPDVAALPHVVVALHGFFSGGFLAEVYAGGTVFWPHCDAREGWVSRVDGPAVDEALAALRAKMTDGRLAGERVLARDAFCHDDVRYDVTFVDGARSGRWSWTDCETRSGDAARAAERIATELAPLYALAGQDPCRVD